MSYNRKDHFFKKAKEEGYAARSAFKLEEIDEKAKLIRSGQVILDLGCAPGSWAQYASRKIGPKGKLIGVDLQEVGLTLPNALFVKGDIHETDFEALLKSQGCTLKVDLVISDMAPKTTGIRVTDQARSLELCEMALATALKHLKVDGAFVCKLFHSQEFEGFRKELRKHFKKVEVMRPKSTRQESKEIFFLCQGFSAATTG